MSDQDRLLLFHLSCGVASLMATVVCMPGLPAPISDRLREATERLGAHMEKWAATERGAMLAKAEAGNELSH
jgi:hypothetical protein